MTFSGLRITLLGTQALPQQQPFLFDKFLQVKLLRVYKGHAGVPLISARELLMLEYASG